MVANSVQITSSGGTRLATSSYTEGGNTVHDEKMIFGENYIASYIVTHASASVSTATANSHLMTINAGASLKVRIRRIEIYQHALATTAAFMALVLVRTTTAAPTGGTAVTPAPLDTTDSASGCTAMTLPTTKATESTIVAGGDLYMVQTAGASSTFITPPLVWDFDRPRSKPLIIQAGTTIGLAVKNLTAIAAGSVSIQVWLDETSF